MRPPSPVSGPSSCVGAGPRPARLIDAKRAEGSPLIRHSIRRATFPPEGGRLWGRLEAAPAGCLRSLRRGALCAPAGLPPAAPILPGQARSPRGVGPPIQHTSGGSTNGGTGCRPPPAPDAGAMPKARVSRIGGPGRVWPVGPRRSRSHTGHTPPAALCLLCRRGQSKPPRRAESLGGGDGGMEGRPLIRRGIRRATFPPVGGRL